jgi:hypothetical protein
LNREVGERLQELLAPVPDRLLRLVVRTPLFLLFDL